MTHDELQNDLATHLRGNTDRMVWTNTQLGPSASPRPDVFTVAKSYSRFAADAYEVKISVPDLRRDVTSGKWQSYRKFAHRVWFAMPAGLVSLDDIPRECGVIVRHAAAWRAARKPVAQVLDTLPRDAWLKLLIESFPTWPQTERQRSIGEWQAVELARKRWGDEIAGILRERAHGTRAYEDATQRLKDSAAEIDAEVKRRREIALHDLNQQRLRIDEAQRALGVVLGMAHDEINADSLARKLTDMRWRLGRAGLKHAIELLQDLSKIAEEERAAA
jgi:hypothetical protein